MTNNVTLQIYFDVIILFLPFSDFILPTIFNPSRNNAVAEKAFPRVSKKLSMTSGTFPRFQTRIFTTH